MFSYCIMKFQILNGGRFSEGNETSGNSGYMLQLFLSYEIPSILLRTNYMKQQNLLMNFTDLAELTNGKLFQLIVVQLNHFVKLLIHLL